MSGRPYTGRTCPEHRGRYSPGCEGCRAYSRSKARSRAARLSKKPPRIDVSLTPAELTLEAYRRLAPFVVANLVKEFGEAAALRLLNGKPAPAREVAPFDPALLEPPGAIGIPRIHSRGRNNTSEPAAGW